LAACDAGAAVPLVGFLDFRSAAENTRAMAEFRQGLAEAGYVEGRNVAIEYRWAEGHFERVSELADDLVRRHPAVIVAAGSIGTALAAKAATSVIPIVFMNGEIWPCRQFQQARWQPHWFLFSLKRACRRAA
jgi:putative tryptophan/tyrosine transport system substrate-binding protein